MEKDKFIKKIYMFIYWKKKIKNKCGTDGDIFVNTNFF